MAINPRNRKPLRTLAALAVLIVGLYGLLAAVVTWGSAQWTPKLGLDLEGGTQLILKPVITNGGSISQDQINQAVDIMRQRVDSTGVSEAEVTTQGGSNVVVSLPGTPDKATIDS
ncbi:MAG TPA: protein translocase subunit SecD, partial [Oryzihumus sp.]|nr:protein translocase subunit SecD [Oryzihumus sp.]